MTRLAVKFLCWTLETFNVYWMSTLLVSLLVLVHILCIKALLVITAVVWRSLLPVTCIILVTGWSRLHKWLPPLVLTCWEVCALMSHQINLSCLVVICLLLAMPGSCLWTLYLLCKLPDLACGKLSRSMLLSLIVLETLFIFKEEPKDVPMKYLGSFWGYFAKVTLVCTALYHSSTDLFPCWKLVRRSNLALTSLDCGL